MLLLRYKEVYDGVFSMRVMLRNDGSCGVIFRAKDPFNYYVFEMVRDGKNSMKRVRKMVNGRS
jgi:hypothetical protein